MMKFQTLILVLGILGLVGVLLLSDTIQIVNREGVGKLWVLLVAGSKGIKNYRHQVDIYHAYHLIREGGIKDEQIVVFHYNDIAGHPDNPFPGTVRHEHGGQDFYPGVPWDYTGTDVNSDNVLAVLAGNRQMVGKNKKVIMSNSKDTVFVFWSGHGQLDNLHLPKITDAIHTDDLRNVLSLMREKNRFKSMVLYIDTCHSGCMFQPDYLEDKGIYAITSTNCSHPSYSTNNGYYGPNLQSHSWATAFGRAWICDSEQHDRRTRSVGQQFNEVKWNLTRSVVMEFGAKELKNEKLFRYQGFKKERFWWWWYR